MRVFIAIELPELVRSRIAAFAQDLRTKLADPKGVLRWVKPEQYHLTLKFLGNCADHQIAKLHHALEETARDHTSFGLSFEGAGFFKSGSSLRVLWLGVSEGKEKVSRLADDLNEACSVAGFPREEKPFHPHLTLARSKESFSARTIESIVRQIPSPALSPVLIEKVSLIESTLSPQGPHYTTLYRVPLSAGSC